MFTQLRARLMAWMRDRHGPDQLYKALLFVFFALIVLNFFLQSSIVYYLSIAVMAYATFRAFSKDRIKRSKENMRYVAFRDKWKKKAMQLVNRFKERDTHVYRDCPNCKTTLRLQKKVGVMHVKCPRCKTEFDLSVKR